jgi:hypothetical protein
MFRKGIEYSRGKFIGGEEFAKRFYEEHIDCGYRGEARRQHMDKWLHSMGGGVWGVVNITHSRGDPEIKQADP